MMKHAILAAAALLAASGASAAVSDASGDFLATYTGPQNGDLDILSAGVTFDGTNFNVSATMDGAIGSTAGSLYVWGINRGAGTPRLGVLGAPPAVGPSVLFDAVFVLFPDGNARAVTFPAMGPPSITPLSGIVSIAGNSLSASVALSLLPSTGFAAADYTFTLWSRRRVDPAMDGTNAEIADFAPDFAGFTASVPEPETWAMMIAGFGLIGSGMRRRSQNTAMARYLS